MAKKKFINRQFSSEISTVPLKRNGLYLTDGNAYTLGVNKVYENLTGISEQQVLGQHMHELVKKGFFDQSVSLLVLDTVKPVTISQLVIPTNRRVIVSGNPIFNSRGEITLITTIVEADEHQNLKNDKNDMELFSAITLPDLGSVVAVSSSMKDVINKAIRLATFDTTVLISGETGVGKEVIAKIIHQYSKRKSGPFIKVNVAAIPEEIFESEMFGYKAGACQYLEKMSPKKVGNYLEKMSLKINRDMK